MSSFSFEPLFIRAIQGDKTYVGARFCSTESRLRSMMENAPPELVFALQDARHEVQNGEDPRVAMEYIRSPELHGNPDNVQKAIQHCLSRIALGTCTIYPGTP